MMTDDKEKTLQKNAALSPDDLDHVNGGIVESFSGVLHESDEEHAELARFLQNGTAYKALTAPIELYTPELSLDLPSFGITEYAVR